MQPRPVTTHALLDAGLSRDPAFDKDAFVKDLSDFLMAHDAYRCEHDAMRAMVGHYRAWEIMHPLVLDAMRVANEIMVVAREMARP